MFFQEISKHFQESLTTLNHISETWHHGIITAGTIYFCNVCFSFLPSHYENKIQGGLVKIWKKKLRPLHQCCRYRSISAVFTFPFAPSSWKWNSVGGRGRGQVKDERKFMAIAPMLHIHSKTPCIVTMLWLDSDWVVTILSPTTGTSERLQNCASVPLWFLHSDYVYQVPSVFLCSDCAVVY